jgi:hypothetical protein
MCAHKNRRGIAEKMGHPYGIAGVKKEVKSYSYSVRYGAIKKISSSLDRSKRSGHYINNTLSENLKSPGKKYCIILLMSTCRV